MPSTRYSFSVHTEIDGDIIEFLDSFIPRERTQFLKLAIREYITQINAPEIAILNDNNFEEQIDKIFEEVAKLRKEIQNNTITIPINSDTIKEETIDEDTRNNIKNLFNKD